MISLDRLPQQEKGEKVELFLRRHRFIIIKEVALLVFLCIAPPLIYIGIKLTFPTLLANDFIYTILIFGFSTYFLYIWLVFFGQFVDYYLDVWVVTNRRIINIEQKGLFYRTISEQRLYRIQDVTSEVKGFLPTFLHYGNIHIQSAGEKHWFNFKEIPNPYEVRKRILELIEMDRAQSPVDYKSDDYGQMLKKTGAV